MRTELDVSIPGGSDTAAPCDLVRALDADPRFRRDGVLGGIFHPGKASYREISPTGSLHVVIDGDRISAHVDDVSPLVVRPDGSAGYHWGRVLAHNLLVMIGDVGRRARGLAGAQRCNLSCQVEWVDDDEDRPHVEGDCA
jgi:hypothetical protein